MLYSYGADAVALLPVMLNLFQHLSLSILAKQMMTFYTYIMSNFARTVFYVGVTSNIEQRVWQHKSGEGGAFTSAYKCHYLMHYEDYSDIRMAIEREKNLKNWKREWKVNLIRQNNPELLDLAAEWQA